MRQQGASSSISRMQATASACKQAVATSCGASTDCKQKQQAACKNSSRLQTAAAAGCKQSGSRGMQQHQQAASRQPHRLQQQPQQAVDSPGYSSSSSCMREAAAGCKQAAAPAGVKQGGSKLQASSISRLQTDSIAGHKQQPQQAVCTTGCSRQQQTACRSRTGCEQSAAATGWHGGSSLQAGSTNRMQATASAGSKQTAARLRKTTSGRKQRADTRSYNRRPSAHTVAPAFDLVQVRYAPSKGANSGMLPGIASRQPRSQQGQR